MRYHLLSVFFALAAVPLACLAILLSPRWNDLRVKHTWKAVPENWENLGLPPAGTTINLHAALRPHRENALIAVLYEVSSPGHPKYVLSITLPPTHVLTRCKASPSAEPETVHFDHFGHAPFPCHMSQPLVP